MLSRLSRPEAGRRKANGSSASAKRENKGSLPTTDEDPPRTCPENGTRIVSKGDALVTHWIHGQAYDLTEWMPRHPGGTYLLEITRGSDCTGAWRVVFGWGGVYIDPALYFSCM